MDSNKRNSLSYSAFNGAHPVENKAQRHICLPTQIDILDAKADCSSRSAERCGIIEPILTNFNRRWIDNIIGHRRPLKNFIKADEHGTRSNTAGSEEDYRGNSSVILAYGLVNDSSNIIANVCDLIGFEVPSNLKLAPSDQLSRASNILRSLCSLK